MRLDRGGNAAGAATVEVMQADALKPASPSDREHRAINAASRPWTAWGIGALPPIVLAAGIGLMVCSTANALSRATLGPAMALYWVGILLIALPVFFRLTSREASTTERLGLVCLLGLTLYGVKVLRDAPMFTFNDELIHAFNANQIAQHSHLFKHNSILEVTSYYPGLEGATSALAQLTGLSTYAAGTILMAACRLSLVGALFFLFKRVSGSARTAGLAAALYACNFNFFFYEAQYSYESLALPLLVVVLMLLAEREASPLEALREWAVPVTLAIAAIVVTHHLTSYALVGILVALSLAYRGARGTWRSANPWRFGVLAGLLAFLWLIVVASSTVGYLSPPLSGAFEAIGHTVAGEAPPRALFQSTNSYIGVTPLGARAVALIAVALIAIGLPFGLYRMVQTNRRQPFAIVFAIAAVGFFGTLALRLAPAAWETGNRASEFLFIGLAFVLASTGLQNWRPRSSALLGRLSLTVLFGFLVVGGAISGWPWDAQLAQPLRASANGGEIVSQPLAMAEWAAEDAPEGKFAAATADANLLLVPGGRDVTAGSSPDVADILTDPNLASWQLPLLRNNDLRFVVVDRRKISSDGIRGYYFSRDDSRVEEPLLPDGVVSKFQRLGSAARVYSNGAITVFDLEGKP
jgi:hypothetical protein